MLAPFGFIGGGGAGGIAQNPPTVSVAPYARYDCAGPFWQDSARTTPATADGDPIGAWDDRSGNGRHAVQATAAQRMVLKLGIKNGKNVARNDGVGNRMARWYDGNGIVPPGTVFIVFNNATTTTDGRAFYDGGETSLTRWWMDESGGNWRIGGSSSFSKAGATDGWNYATNVYNLAASSIQIAQGAVQTGTLPNEASKGITIGGGYHVSVNSIQGDIAELIHYPAALSAGDTLLIQQYLAAKYAI